LRSSNSDAWVSVGRIRGAHGLTGEFAVEPLTDVAGRFAEDSILYLSEPGAAPKPVQIESSRPHKNFRLIKLVGIETRAAAEVLRGRDLMIPETSLVDLPPHHHYPFRLIGCRVVEGSGNCLGEVAGVFDGGGGTLLQVKDGEREILVPMVQGIITLLDEKERKIEVRLPEGLAELNAPKG
jgi:16S rRNA processing protein RimM